MPMMSGFRESTIMVAAAIFVLFSSFSAFFLCCFLLFQEHVILIPVFWFQFPDSIVVDFHSSSFDD